MIGIHVGKIHKVSTLICASIALSLPFGAAWARSSYPGDVQAACSDLGVSIAAPACTYCHTDGGFTPNALSKSDAMALLCPNLPVSQNSGTNTGTNTGTTTANTGTTTTPSTGTASVSNMGRKTVSNSNATSEEESVESRVKRDFEERMTRDRHSATQTGDQAAVATADQPPMSSAGQSHNHRAEHRSVNLSEQQVRYSNRSSGERTTGGKRHGRHHDDD
jgi:hypothetical protein